ncbi:MAG: WD40 repeat domain-containing protein, partial [Verrucomicrobiota bacterium]
DALAKVRDSYLAQAQAGRWSHRAGRRFTGLTLLKKAAEIRPGIDLRSEAIACLALTDLRTVAEWNAYPLNGLFGGFDANYSRYAYADKTGKIRVCRVGNETPLFEVGSPSSPLIDLCFSRRGALLHVTGSGESSRVQAFDVEGKTCLWQVDGPRYRTADSSADGKYLAISYEENSSNWPIRVVDASTGREAASFGHGSLPYFIRFNPMDSRQLLSSDAGTVVRLWDWTSGRIVHSFEHPSWVMGIDWDPAGNLVATACADNVLRFWDTTTGLEGTSLRGHEWTPTRVSISASRGRYLISHGWDGVLKLWDLAAKRALVDEPIFGTIFPFSRSDDRFACTTAWGKIAILEVVPGVGYTVLQRNGDPDRGITCDFSSDGRWLLSTHERSVCLWDLKTGEEVEAIQQHRGDMFATFVPGSVQFYLAGRNAVETWRINPNASRGSTRMALQQSFEGKSAISRPQRTPQGRTVTIGPDGFVTILNPLTGKEESRVSAIRAVEFAALSADGHFAATWNRFSESLDIYDLTTSKHVRELPAHASIVAEFSQDGRYLIVGDGVEYRAHTVGEWKSLYAIPRHSAGFWGYLAISSDSRMAALAISRNTVTLIETSTGVELAALEAPVPTGIHGLAFNGDGSQLASVNNEGAIQLWNLQMIRQELAAMNLDWETTSAAQIPRRAVAPP